MLLLSQGEGVIAQSNAGEIAGKVVDGNGVAVPFANVVIDSLQIGAVADAQGIYQLAKVPAGRHSVKVSSIGFQSLVKLIDVKAGNRQVLDFGMKEDVRRHSEVTVAAEANRTEAEQLRQQAYTVNSIDVRPLQNLNIDVNNVLNRSPGIRIRQSGGLGSDFNFSLNGFSGNQVRFFIDGLPADYLGEAMQFNNIPVNVIERVEVYKGVVPVNLGADALGGAVNIVTSTNVKDFLDVSYSFGSFNTHQVALASRLTFKDRYVANASGFFNYSDNSFTVEAPTVDPVSGSIGNPQTYTLFNEDYQSGSAMVEGGVVNTKWADRLLVGLIASGNKKHYQRGQSMVLHPIGEAYSTDLGFTPTLKYQKKNLFTNGLSLNLTSIYSYTEALTVDTSSRIYNWDGSYEYRAFEVYSGEFSWYRSMFQFTDHATVTTATLEYALGKRHTFTLNNTFSYFTRQGTDPIASLYSSNLAFDDPNTLTRNITGASYRLSLWQNRWNTTVFVKGFYMDALMYAKEEFADEMVAQHNRVFEHGEGIATSLMAMKGMLLKASYEYTSRLPESYELMGDGKLLMPNAELQPEHSHNMNLGAMYEVRFGKGHHINVEGGFIYRRPENLIRLVSIGVLGQYMNQTFAEVMGGEGAVRYAFRNWLNAEVNVTYQDMRNANKVIDTYPDPLYNDRLPNIPYLFGNATVAVRSPEMGKQSFQLAFNWATMYVEQFYLNWPSQGNASDKHIIPTQVSHDASLSLSAFKGRYNLSFTCVNIADSKLYDNYKVQRPGRSFNVKFRFYLTDLKRKSSQ